MSFPKCLMCGYRYARADNANDCFICKSCRESEIN